MRALAVLFVAGYVMLAGGIPASAEGFYAGGMLGVGAGGGETDKSGYDLEFDPGLFLNGFVGKDLGSVRVEGEVAYRQNDFNKFGGIPVYGEMTSVAYMANIYYDVENDSVVTPYVGLGVGVARVTFDSVVISDEDNAFALQLITGVSFLVSRSVSIIVDLHIFGAIPKFEDGSGVPFEQVYGVSTLAVGLSVSF